MHNNVIHFRSDECEEKGNKFARSLSRSFVAHACVQ